MRLVLASASPRRAELLTAAGYSFEVHAVDLDERVHRGETARVYVQRLAVEKSERALEELSRASSGVRPAVDLGDLVVLAADTAVVAGEQILGKPADVEDASRMLRRLAGRTHQVLTGVSVRSVLADVVHVEATAVTFSALTEEQIAWYVSSGEGRDKAGGYAIQGLAARFIPRIEGSYANVVGLPIATIDGLIRRLSWPPGVLASHE